MNTETEAAQDCRVARGRGWEQVRVCWDDHHGRFGAYGVPPRSQTGVPHFTPTYTAIRARRQQQAAAEGAGG